MTFGLLSLAMLLGLGAVAIPPIIHLLNRRRYQVVDWGAMQFLRIGQAKRRRLMLEELLLMLLRMAVIAVLVLALAAPYAAGPALARFTVLPNRDVVLVIDGSHSMGLQDGKHPSPHQQARDWALAYLDQLRTGDRVAVLLAGLQARPLIPELTQDLEYVRARLQELPEPQGGCAGPRVIQDAHKILEGSSRSERAVIVLSDAQRTGWADASSLFQWERLLPLFKRLPGEDAKQPPQLAFINLSALEANQQLPNYAVGPIRPPRTLAWAGQVMQLKTSLRLTGHDRYTKPHKLRLEINGQHIQDLPLPADARLEHGQVPLTFQHRFATAGSYLVSVLLEPDVPVKERAEGYVLRDVLPGDNRRDLALEVVDELPVLLVDGASQLDRESATFFLARALELSPEKGKPPVLRPRVVSIDKFDPLLLQSVDPKNPGSKPRVLVLADVAKLSEAQQQGIEQFLEGGGGVLTLLGGRVTDATHYNDKLFRDGQGWLPARLLEQVGDLEQPDQAAALEVKQFQHPALDIFRDEPNGTLGKVRLRRWWRVVTPAQSAGVPVAMLTTADPFLVERTYKAGKVLLASIPFDRTWQSTLPSTWDFPVLAHELIYYLADIRAGDFNLQPGQPLRYQPAGRADSKSMALPLTLRLRLPGHQEKSERVTQWPFVFENTFEAGVYWLAPTPEKRIAYVVDAPAEESDLTPLSEDERGKIAALVPVQFRVPTDVRADVTALPNEVTHDIWWVLLVAVMLLLCSEVWMTRRMVKARQII